ncbi:hypothetical protein EJB01_06270 [Klebsiella pneumoniae]|uniref:hypothetical protein n=1 Tax=Klebsiella pneumoniae TaxID=573 RepID=UPI0013E97384|nr:hypothetical protein [Klebsiella pneumoniae]QIH85860.1 hypothetical protein EJB01_06270 [Klebsiella pneumoniae]
MTDITRLITSLKRRSAHTKEFGHDVLFVKIEDLDALVEALEKAQQLATQQGNIACALFDEVTAQRQRIAELEEAEQQLCAANVTLDARAELAERQLAELESRTVTVKLPTTRLWAGVTECYEKSDVIAAIRSAGMEVSDD